MFNSGLSVFIKELLLLFSTIISSSVVYNIYILLCCILASYSLVYCDLTPLTLALYLSLKLPVLEQSYLELFIELSNFVVVATLLDNFGRSYRKK